MPITGAKLTPKQLAFVTAYASGASAGNGKRSAIAAGYASRSAEVTASRMLRDAKVLSVLAAIRAKAGVIAATTESTVGEVARKIKPWLDLVPAAQTALEDATQKNANVSLVRVMAADKILDRAYGKPVARAIIATRSIDDALAALDEEGEA